MTPVRQLAALTALAVALAGCQDPYQQPSKPAARHPVDTSHAPSIEAADDTSRPGPPPAPYLPAAPGSGARTSVAAFARRWANWDWRTAAAQQRRLARLATGRLAARLRSGAHATANDASLPRDNPSSRGEVVAIDLKQTQLAAAGVVVTREQSYTGGHADLGGNHYRVYLTTLIRRDGRWGITRWEPQP